MTSTPLPDNIDNPPAVRRALHDHWRVFLAEGIVLVVLGAAAIVFSPLAGLAATVLLGWLFLIAGVAGLVATFRARAAPGFAWSLLSAILALVAAFFLLWNPLRGLVTLTLVMTGFFLADGVLMIFLALSHRKDRSDRWQWLLVNGAMDLVLAGVIISGFPGTLVWAPGFLLGIDLAFGGATLIGMALRGRKEA